MSGLCTAVTVPVVVRCGDGCTVGYDALCTDRSRWTAAAASFSAMSDSPEYGAPSGRARTSLRLSTYMCVCGVQLGLTHFIASNSVVWKFNKNGINWLYRGGDIGYPNRPTCRCYGAQEKTRENAAITSGVNQTFGVLTNFLTVLFLFTLTTK